MNVFVCISPDDELMEVTETDVPDTAALWFHAKFCFEEGTKFHIIYEVVAPFSEIDDELDPVLLANKESNQVTGQTMIKYYIVKNNNPVHDKSKNSIQ